MQFYITCNYELNIKTKISLSNIYSKYNIESKISYCLIPTQKVFTLGKYFSMYKTL